MKSTAFLIAEGDELLRRDLKRRLFQHGFQVIKALHRTDILQLFLNTKPDLAIIGSSPANAWDELKVPFSHRDGSTWVRYAASSGERITKKPKHP